MSTLMMEMVSNESETTIKSDLFPFQHLGQALAFYNNCNPARAKSLCLTEPEGDSKSQSDKDFERGIWAGVALAIGDVLHDLPASEYWAWTQRNLGDRTEQRAVSDIARAMLVSVPTVYRVLNRIDHAIEKNLQRREILPPAESDIN